MKSRFLAILARAVMVLMLIGLTIPMSTPAMASQITLIKEDNLAPPPPAYYLGSTITFKLVVGNPVLNLQTNTLSLIEDILPDGTTHVTKATGVVQPPGASNTYTQTYVVVLADIDPVTHKVQNTLHATGVDSLGDDIDATTQKQALIIQPNTTVTISSSPVGPVLPGSTVILTVTEKNNDIGPLTSPNVVVSSVPGTAVPPMPLTLNKASGPSGDGGVIGTLDGGETWTWTVPGVVINANTVFTANGDGIDLLGNHVNFDTVKGTTPGISTERASIPVNVVQPNTNVTISSSASHVAPGGKVDLIITETNTGAVNLTSPRVDLTASPAAGTTSSWTLDVTNLFSGDGVVIGELDTGAPGETWIWHVNGVIINAITDFTATGHGFTGGTDITYPTYSNERKQIRVNVDHPHTTLNMTVVGSVTELPIGGGNVSLTIIDTNDGDVSLINPYVVLGKIPAGVPFPMTLGKASASYVSGDSNGDGIQDPTEAWKWVVGPFFLTTDTTFTATGHGTDPVGTDITYPTYPERSQVSLTIPRVPAVSNLGIGLMIAAFAAAIALFATRRGRRPSLHS